MQNLFKFLLKLRLEELLALILLAPMIFFMAIYHGEEGFRNFSHAKTVYTQTKLDSIISVFRPPYGSKAKNALKAQIKP